MSETGPLFVSSGDLIADRRYKWALDQAAAGDFVAAADILTQTLEIAPGFATAWFALGAIRDRLGDRIVGTFPITVWRVGDAFMVSTTGEPYSHYQKELRQRFPGSTVAVLNLTNGATNYLTEANAYQQDNYTTRVTEYAACCLEGAITETASAMQMLS